MRHEGWLHRYSEIGGIGESIGRIAARRPVARGLLGGERLIAENLDCLLEIFDSFYPELILRAHAVIEDLQAGGRDEM